jgi:N-acetylneuraminic acid mutarotase
VRFQLIIQSCEVEMLNVVPRFGFCLLLAAGVAASCFTRGSAVEPDASASSPSASKPTVRDLDPLPRGLTSFGAAVIRDNVYVYGGNLVGAHEYHVDGQSGDLFSLNWRNPAGWKVVSNGPRRQGLAMVAYNDRLYRVGGFAAHNAEGDENDLRSTPDFAEFDPATNTWRDLPEMPSPRSSHDAVVVGSRLYVAGGWNMPGKGEKAIWHDSALMIDLASENPQWKELPSPPFQRRALSLAACGDRVYAVGGMASTNETTLEVAVFDTARNEWSTAPRLPGAGMDGFGTSACSAGDTVFVSNLSGRLYSLQHGAAEWSNHGSAGHSRFFHRLVAADGKTLLLIGGSNRSGKVLSTQLVTLQ